jgi:hypothetical protein
MGQENTPGPYSFMRETTSWSVPAYGHGDRHGGRASDPAQVSKQSLNRFQRIS